MILQVEDNHGVVLQIGKTLNLARSPGGLRPKVLIREIFRVINSWRIEIQAGCISPRSGGSLKQHAGQICQLHSHCVMLTAVIGVKCMAKSDNGGRQWFDGVYQTEKEFVNSSIRHPQCWY